MMKLLHFPMSSNARRVRMAAIALGVELEEEIVDLRTGAHKKPDYLAKNPFGRVPTLIDGDFVLTESHAIMMYIADKSGPTPLFPMELRARAEVVRWFFFASHHLTPAVGTLNFERMIKRITNQGEPDPKEEARGERLLRECADLLDKHLESREWLALHRITLADYSVAAPFMSKVPSRLPIDEYRHLCAWLARVQETDAWKKTNPVL